MLLVCSLLSTPHNIHYYMVSITVRKSREIGIGSHILSRYEFVVRTLGQLKDSPQNTNERVETLLDVNHQLSRVVNTFSSCYRFQFLVLATYTLVFVASRLYFIFLYRKKGNIFTFLLFHRLCLFLLTMNYQMLV